ncbi:hypothetical protein EVAR_60986_1 [Eumeta japonica]|uniref:Uncharacterized protein n=1 Tax=Eumeta variegata TaxID=151549 RepID=A0A4C1XXC3_EUMVA|nr:hypothetical protein EVAR_60986_1 [Eumeta japonica]
MNESNGKGNWSKVAEECRNRYNETNHSVTGFSPKYLLSDVERVPSSFILNFLGFNSRPSILPHSDPDHTLDSNPGPTRGLTRFGPRFRPRARHLVSTPRNGFSSDIATGHACHLSRAARCARRRRCGWRHASDLSPPAAAERENVPKRPQTEHQHNSSIKKNADLPVTIGGRAIGARGGGVVFQQVGGGNRLTKLKGSLDY